MSKKFDKKLAEIERWLDDNDEALNEAGYAVLFHATKMHEDDPEEWYSFTGFPIGLVDSLVMQTYIVGDFLGYENLPAFMKVLTKYASIKHNVSVNHIADEIAMPQHKAICDSIMETYCRSISEFASSIGQSDTAFDELLASLENAED